MRGQKFPCVLAMLFMEEKQKFIYCEKASGMEHKKYCTQFLLPSVALLPARCLTHDCRRVRREQRASRKQQKKECKRKARRKRLSFVLRSDSEIEAFGDFCSIFLRKKASRVGHHRGF